MTLDELIAIIQAAGGAENALAYAKELLIKINRIGTERSCAPLLNQIRFAREEGDFRGRVLEVNFADCFLRKGIILNNAVKQGMKGDIDFCWKLDAHAVYIELKLIGQDRKTRDEINAQLERRGASSIVVNNVDGKGDTVDVARLQADLIQKASTRKFNPTVGVGIINIVAVDVSELQLGTVDLCDCLLAAGGNSLASRYYKDVCLREAVVGAFETIAPNQLKQSQTEWLKTVQKLPEGAPHPKTYIHGALFLFREPRERAALSYDLCGAMVWNHALIAVAAANQICSALHDVIPRAKADGPGE